MRALGLVWATIVDAASWEHPELRVRLNGAGVVSGDCVVLYNRAMASTPSEIGGAVDILHAQERLWPTLRSVGSRTMLAGAHRAVGGVGGLFAGPVAGALKLLDEAGVPYTKVQALAADVPCELEALRRHWRRDLVARGVPRLKRTLNGWLLMKLLAQDASRRDAAPLQREWRIGADRGHDIAMSCIGCGYAEVKAAALPTFFRWFREHLISPLEGIAAGRRVCAG